MNYRTVAIPSDVAESVRRTLKSPEYGHPAHLETATGHGPCRHCLRAFRVGADRRILFTYDAFRGVDTAPRPGPIFIHAEPCTRFPDDGGFPADLRAHGLTLTCYRKGRVLLKEIHVDGSEAEAVIEEMLEESAWDYIQVQDTRAGCYDFRIGRASSWTPARSRRTGTPPNS